MVNAAVFTGGKVQASGDPAPVFRGNEMAGAYAVSGATSDQDEVLGEYARLKVG